MTLNAAITGVGMSDIGRKTGRPAMAHLAEAAKRALECAGLTKDDIDGISTYPGKADNSPGMSPLGTGEVRNALGLQTRWHSAVPDGPSQMAPLMVAAMAVATGQARHVLCFRGTRPAGWLVQLSCPCQRHVGIELGRLDGDAILSRIWHDARASGPRRDRSARLCTA